MKMKLMNIFLCLWVIFDLLDPDTDIYLGTPLNAEQIQIGIQIRIHNTGKW
jgi:hypothetical protein